MNLGIFRPIYQPLNYARSYKPVAKQQTTSGERVFFTSGDDALPLPNLSLIKKILGESSSRMV